MEVRVQRSNYWAMTFFEVLVVVVCAFILAAILLPILAKVNRSSSRINCASNLMQINLAFRIWEGDDNYQYPMAVSVTNGGGREFIEASNVGAFLQVVSNELSTTKILICPNDPDHTFATNFNDLNNSNISYFFSADVSNDANPDTIFDGDDNFELNGSPVKSGLFDLSSNSLVEWAPGRHSETYRPHPWSFPQKIYFGNFSFADGSVERLMTWRLQNQLRYVNPETNRIAIP